LREFVLNILKIGITAIRGTQIPLYRVKSMDDQVVFNNNYDYNIPIKNDINVIFMSL